MEDTIVQSVIDKFQQRSDVGIRKYGTTLDREDLSILDWITHLQEELMDAVLYSQKIKKQLEDNKDGIVITKENWDNADKIIHEGFVYVKYSDLYSL
jgi:hypothetical protein